jgi:hypothetical protein
MNGAGMSEEQINDWQTINGVAGRESNDFIEGFFLGILVGEGHFGGDGKQPQVTLKMHVRHEPLFRWILVNFPGGKLYGPYHHDGRHYFQWMARGTFLRDTILPFLERRLHPGLDVKTFLAVQRMRFIYAAKLGLPVRPQPPSHVAEAPSDSGSPSPASTQDWRFSYARSRRMPTT